ncbi:MAG: hypothetical protein U5J63_17005 [Fodinibius sp.]|nr:hypothetical protein [Fodinibius sp.]
MELRRFLLEAVFVMLIMVVGCKSSQPQYEFVNPSERVGWQQKIKSGNVGFYDVRQEKTANIDTPPKVKEQTNLHAAVEVPNSCIKHARQSRKKMVGKVEFLVDEQGNTGNFFILKDVGKCNDALAKSFKAAEFTPAMADGEPMPTVVHFTMIFRFVNQGTTQQQVY